MGTGGNLYALDEEVYMSWLSVLENIGAAPNLAMASSLTLAAAQIRAVKQASIAKSGGS